MNDLTTHARLQWALLLSRLLLGIMFTMGAWWRLFGIGPVEHASRFFVGPYADSWLPVWSLWTAGVTIPVVEMLAGLLLMVGYRVRMAAVVLGVELLVVAFGHFLAEPLFSITDHIFPRLVLVLVILVLPVEHDWLALDRRRAGPR